MKLGRGTSDRDFRRAVQIIERALPEGMGFTLFLSSDAFGDGAATQVSVMGNQRPEEFSETIRAWLARYDAGVQMGDEVPPESFDA